MDKALIKELIDYLKERPVSPDIMRELAHLYIVYDHLCEDETE